MTEEKCFACEKPLSKAAPYVAVTADGQQVFVGIECIRRIREAGNEGYEPPKGGPKLYPIS